MNEWQPIENIDNLSDDESSVVELYAPDEYNRKRVIGFKGAYNEFFCLNFECDPEGTILLPWQPTHFRKLPSPEQPL